MILTFCNFRFHTFFYILTLFYLNTSEKYVQTTYIESHLFHIFGSSKQFLLESIGKIRTKRSTPLQNTYTKNSTQNIGWSNDGDIAFFVFPPKMIETSNDFCFLEFLIDFVRAGSSEVHLRGPKRPSFWSAFKVDFKSRQIMRLY